MAKKGLNSAIARLLLISLILCMVVFWIPGIALADEVTVITNIPGWEHPVKDVLKKQKVELYKVELQKNKTYPLFYVKFPYDPLQGPNARYFKTLYYETLKANGFWDYAFIAPEDNCRINIKWDKNTKTLTEDQIELESSKR